MCGGELEGILLTLVHLTSLAPLSDCNTRAICSYSVPLCRYLGFIILARSLDWTVQCWVGKLCIGCDGNRHVTHSLQASTSHVGKEDAGGEP